MSKLLWRRPSILLSNASYVFVRTWIIHHTLHHGGLHHSSHQLRVRHGGATKATKTAKTSWESDIIGFSALKWAAYRLRSGCNRGPSISSTCLFLGLARASLYNVNDMTVTNIYTIVVRLKLCFCLKRISDWSLLYEETISGSFKMRPE
jgi:hypothetical protein